LHCPLITGQPQGDCPYIDGKIMNIKNKNKKLIITLASESVISDAEADLQKLIKALTGDIKKIELQAKSANVIDTAYFQILLSLKNTAEQKQIPFAVSDISPAIQEVCELYGMNLV